MGDKKIREVVKEKFCSINWGDFLREELLWAAVGFLMEFASVPLSAAPAGAALAAGLSGTRSLWALIGTIAGALCSGSSGMAVGISSAAIVLAGKLLPDMGKPAIRAAERFFAAGAAVFFSRMAAGTFNAGASIELSADAPIREPYTAYFQGGLTYEHCKIACRAILEKLV